MIVGIGKRSWILAAAVLLCLCLTGAAADGMTDFPASGFTLFHEGSLAEAPGQFLVSVDGMKTDPGSGITMAVCVYAPGAGEGTEAAGTVEAESGEKAEETGSEEAGSDTAESGIVLFTMVGIRNGSSTEEAAALPGLDSVEGLQERLIPMGGTGDTAWYLYPAEVREETMQAFAGTVSRDVLDSVPGLIREIAEHPDYFVFKNPGECTYAVRVRNTDGQPVPGTMLLFCTDVMCMTVRTDAAGRGIVTSAPDTYHVQLLKAPEGYQAPEEEPELGPDSGEAVLVLTK